MDECLIGIEVWGHNDEGGSGRRSGNYVRRSGLPVRVAGEGDVVACRTKIQEQCIEVFGMKIMEVGESREVVGEVRSRPFP